MAKKRAFHPKFTEQTNKLKGGGKPKAPPRQRGPQFSHSSAMNDAMRKVGETGC